MPAATPISPGLSFTRASRKLHRFKTPTAVATVLLSPVAVGAVIAGRVVSCSPGTWTTAIGLFTYQWQSSPDGSTGWTNIGARQNTYTLTSAEVGRYARCLVVATNAAGTSVAAPSNTLGFVQAASTSQYGVAAGPPSNIQNYYNNDYTGYVAKMKAMGVQIIRADFSPGTSNPFYSLATAAVAAGLDVLPILMIRANSDIPTILSWCDDLLLRSWVRKVELGNEVNGASQYQGTVSAADYIAKAQAASQRLRTNPNVILCAAGLANYGAPAAPGNVDTVTFLQQLIDGGLASYVDAFGLHLYGDWAWATLLPACRSAMVGRGVGAWPFWISEWGEPTNSGTVFTAGVSEAALAAEVTTRFAFFTAQSYIADTEIYSGIDRNTVSGSSAQDHYGQYHTDGTAKASEGTYAAAIATYTGGAPPSPPPAGSTFGYATIGASTDTQGVDSKQVCLYTALAGNLAKISGYVSGLGGGTGTQKVRAVVYADSGGAPGALIAVSSEVIITAGQAWGWVDWPFVGLPAISAGPIWMGYWAGTTFHVVAMRYDANLTTLAYKADTYSSGANPTTPFGAATLLTWAYSLLGTLSTGNTWFDSGTFDSGTFDGI